MYEEIIWFPKVNEDEPFQIQMCGKSFCDGTYKIHREKSSVWCIEYVYQGEGYVILDDMKFKVAAGDIYILPQGRRHYYYSDDKNPWEKIWFNIRGDFVLHTMEVYGLSHVYHIRNLDLSHIFEKFLQQAKQHIDNEDCKGALDEGAVLFLKMVQEIANAPQRKDKTEEPGNVELLKRKIDGMTDFGQDYDEMLQGFFYSKSYMIREFKRVYGITPYNYLLNHKMNMARSLLRNTAMSINEVSNYLGFANAHYFSNFFSKREGISPKEYRMSLATFVKLE